MLRTAFVFQVIIAPLVMGVLALLALLTPGMGSALGAWILAACVGGFLMAIPISLIAAKSGPGMSL